MSTKNQVFSLVALICLLAVSFPSFSAAECDDELCNFGSRCVFQPEHGEERCDYCFKETSLSCFLAGCQGFNAEHRFCTHCNNNPRNPCLTDGDCKQNFECVIDSADPEKCKRDIGNCQEVGCDVICQQHYSGSSVTNFTYTGPHYGANPQCQSGFTRVPLGQDGNLSIACCCMAGAVQAPTPVSTVEPEATPVQEPSPEHEAPFLLEVEEVESEPTPIDDHFFFEMPDGDEYEESINDEALIDSFFEYF